MAIYAVSDLHGCLDAYKKIKKYIKPEDTVYCLGDCGDRGPEPWNTLKAVLTDSQFIYIKGNHDDMLVKAAREAMDGSWGCEDQRLLAINGGMETLEGLLGEESPERWVSYIAKLPTHLTYENILLCHAGCSLWKDNNELPSNYDLMWDRLHYFDNATLLDNKIVVHGHTPMMYLAKDIGERADGTEAFKYADGKKYCIDAGTFATGHVILLNLDTFESIHFDLND